jgi:hypothetical protein
MSGWQCPLVGLAFVVSLILLVFCTYKPPKRNNRIELNPMFQRDWKDKP